MAYAMHAESASTPGTINSTGIVLGTTDDTTAGNFELQLDTSLMTDGDIFEIQFRAIARSGETKRIARTMILVNAQYVPTVKFGPFAAPSASGTAYAWDFFAKKLAGTDRAMKWSIQKGP